MTRRFFRPGGLWVCLLGLLAVLGPYTAAGATEVRLQLKWHHQFQFAGYYAAQSQGYYAEEGLAVKIIEGNPRQPPVATVLAGGADFGVSDTDVLLNRLRGGPLVVCAAIFQHSPYVLVSRADRGIRVPAHLIGARVMLQDAQGAAQFHAMLRGEGIAPERVESVRHSWNLDDLIEGRVDAMSAYATVEPARLRARGVEPAMLRAIDYGVDFYGDTLFTTDQHASRHPVRTEAFVRASLRGWTYAMNHPEELADQILKLPGVVERGITRRQLLDEAAAMRPLILSDVVEIGHMNLGRWQRIADTFVSQGMAPAGVSLDGFICDTGPHFDPAFMRWIPRLAVGAGFVVVGVLAWNIQMRRSVRRRTRELREEVARREKAELQLRTSAERLKLAQAVGGIGDWRFDVATGRIDWSETMFRLFERDPALGAPGIEDVLALHHPDDGLRLRESVRRSIETGESYALDLYLRLPGGREVCHHAIGHPVRDETGRVIALHGVTQDITGRKQAEERVRSQLRQLERWRDATLGREERIQALKAEINALLAESSRPPRYAVPPGPVSG